MGGRTRKLKSLPALSEIPRYGDLENAIAWIQQARKQDAGKSDVSLEERTGINFEYYDDVIDQWGKQYNEMPNDPEIKASWEDAIKNRKDYQKSQLESWCKGIPTISDIDMN